MKRLLVALLAACTFPSPAIDNPDCPDKDGDGYRDLACQPTQGDCNDDNKDVHPKQSAFFDKPDAKVGFDYDCSGQEDRDVYPPAPVDCPDLLKNPTATCGGSGFNPDPKCGSTSGFKCAKSQLSCTRQADDTLPAVKCH